MDASSAAEVLKTIPKTQQEDLRYLFHILFLEQDGAYTLFGDKPVALAGDFLIPSWKQTIRSKCFGQLGAAWETWQKHKHKFPMPNFVIVGEKCKFHDPECVTLNIFIINKKTFLETIEKHLMIFEDVLGKKIDSETYLQDIENERVSFWTSIQYNEMLLGILLGYGEHNASFFNQQASHAPTVSMKMSSTKLADIKLKSSNRDIFPMMIVNPVQFSADLAHPETKVLQVKYQKARQEICSTYSQGDFLEITLSELTSKR